jgi:tetratricopeptide (TPR) repeat protein
MRSIGATREGWGCPASLAYYQQALSILEAVDDRAGLAATLRHIGMVYAGLGQREQALAYYQQALSILEAVGDRLAERVTRYNIAMIYWRQGQLTQAVEALRQVVALDEQTQHPNLEWDMAMLHHMEQEWQARGA